MLAIKKDARNYFVTGIIFVILKVSWKLILTYIAVTNAQNLLHH
jgi:hypothetical protein